MNNFKKLALGVLVGAMAIGFSAFTNSTKNDKKVTASVFYTLNSANQYVKYTGIGQPSETGCGDDASHRCVIGFDADQGSQLDATALPSTPSYQSNDNGLWTN